MKIIMNVEITDGYEKWKKLFLSVDAQREKYGIKVLAYGHPKGDENKIYQVLEVESIEKMQEAFNLDFNIHSTIHSNIHFNTHFSILRF